MRDAFNRERFEQMRIDVLHCLGNRTVVGKAAGLRLRKQQGTQNPVNPL